MSKNVSRLLSMVLRHKPEKIGIELDKNGYVTIGRLLDQLEVHDHMIDIEELREIVATNGKKRFEINEDDGKGYQGLIRACQGHSVKVDLELNNERPPAILYHGTVSVSIPSIFKDGLKKMNRKFIYLLRDKSTAINVGKRTK